MGDVISNLKVKFGVDAGNSKRELSEVEKGFRDFDRKIQDAGKSIAEMLSPLALIAGAGGALASLKEAISAVEGPGDRLTAVTAGMKEGLFEFQRALVGLDFSNLFSNLEEGFQRGKAFEEAMDSLADRTAYNDYKIAELNRNSESLQEIVKNKTLELKVRTEAAKQVLEIESAIMNRKKELAQQEFDILKNQWESRNKMQADEAVKLYEKIDNMSPELQNRLQKAFATATSNQFGSIKKGIQSVLFGQYDQQLVKEVDKGTLETYAEFFKLLETGERDVLIKLFNTFKNIDQAGYEAQKEYNGVIAQTTKLLAQEEAQLKKTKAASGDDIARVSGPGKVGTDNISMPSLGKSSFDTIVKPAQAASDALKTVMLDIQAINETINSAIQSALSGFATWIGNFATGAASISDLGAMIGSTLGDMLIQLGTIAIKAGVGIEAIKTAFASMTGIGAIAIGVSLIAFGTAIKKSVSQIGSSSGKSGGGGAGGAGGTGSGQGFGNGFSSAASNAQQKPLIITLQGQLVAKGNDLVAVVEQEHRRRRATT